MDTSMILSGILKHISLDKEEEKYFISLLHSKKIKKRHLLLSEGEICRQSAFVNSGCLKNFSVDRNGFEHILAFAPPGWWMADLYSLISGKPGNLNIEAIEDTDVLLLSKEDQQSLYEKVPAFERFFRILVENSLVALQQRLLDNLTLTAEEHYKNFCKRYPSLADHIPQKDVAAYIGITPEFLSKLKSALLKQEHSA
jgi:CRP-like cAMP-binding protein